MGSPLFQPVGLLDNSLDIEDTFESNGLLGGSLDSGRGAREQGSSTSILKQLDLNISLQARDYTASTSKSAVASLSNAQEALNVLGSSRRSPVHPRRPAMDDFGMAPDHEIDIDIEAELELERAMNLERQLEMEREMEEEEALMAAEAQEEERPKPTPASSRPASGNKADGHQSMPALLDLEFESNGLLGGPNSRTSTSQPTDAGAQPPSPSTLPSLSQVLPDTQQAGPSRPLPAWATERFKDRPTINSGTDRAIPKYIPAGTIAAVTFEGNVIRFERRKRMRGWKVRSSAGLSEFVRTVSGLPLREPTRAALRREMVNDGCRRWA